MPMFCFAALFIIQAILFLLKKYRQNTNSVDLLGCNNYFFIKVFAVFNQLKVEPIFYYMHYSLMPHVYVTNNDSIKLISCSEQP